MFFDWWSRVWFLLSCWLVPAWLVAESKGLIGLGVAAVLCTLPGCLVVAFKGLVGDSQAALVLAAGGLRMFFVLLGALAAKFVVTGLRT